MNIQQPTHFIIEGIDRLGKDTLIKNLMNILGYRPVIHFQKPQKLNCYVNSEIMYQQDSFFHLMKMLNSDIPFFYNRSHIGEAVYGPMYRNTDASWLWQLEAKFYLDETNVRLILLTEGENAKHFKSDGESFDDSNRKNEQNAFIRVVNNLTRIQDKRIICVTDKNGEWKNENQIVQEALALI